MEVTLWPRNEIIYTDGIARETGHPGYYSSGAGIFRFASSAGLRVELCVDPIDYNTGAANTVQRAELVGIYKALQIDHAGPDLLICTNSLSSMYMIDKNIRCPGLHKECKHEELLSCFVEALANKAREGMNLKLLKVKSHVGIEGNQEADKLAHEACIPQRCNNTVAEGIEIRENIYWPHFNGRKIHNQRGGTAAIVACGPGPEQSSQADPTRQDDVGLFQANDLRKGLKGIVKPRCSKGFSNQTIYVTAWAATVPYMLGDISNQFWSTPRVTASMVTMLLKYRFGQLWNMKIAYRQQRPYFPGLGPPQSDRCPHCGQPDSGGHILGGCMKPTFKAMYIHRHDPAMRLILKAISKGNHGGYHTIADYWRADSLKTWGSTPRECRHGCFQTRAFLWQEWNQRTDIRSGLISC